MAFPLARAGGIALWLSLLYCAAMLSCIFRFMLGPGRCLVFRLQGCGSRSEGEVWLTVLCEALVYTKSWSLSPLLSKELHERGCTTVTRASSTP